MTELIFLVEENPDGSYSARGLGESIFTEADNIEELHIQIKDAVNCHFDEDERPKYVRLHFVKEELIVV